MSDGPPEELYDFPDFDSVAPKPKEPSGPKSSLPQAKPSETQHSVPAPDTPQYKNQVIGLFGTILGSTDFAGNRPQDVQMAMDILSRSTDNPQILSTKSQLLELIRAHPQMKGKPLTLENMRGVLESVMR